MRMSFWGACHSPMASVCVQWSNSPSRLAWWAWDSTHLCFVGAHGLVFLPACLLRVDQIKGEVAPLALGIQRWNISSDNQRCNAILLRYHGSPIQNRELELVYQQAESKNSEPGHWTGFGKTKKRKEKKERKERESKERATSCVCVCVRVCVHKSRCNTGGVRRVAIHQSLCKKPETSKTQDK